LGRRTAQRAKEYDQNHLPFVEFSSASHDV
jgi:hypothetical protein